MTIVKKNNRGVVEQASEAYKNIDQAVKVIYKLGIGRLVAKVIPLDVMKG